MEEVKKENVKNSKFKISLWVLFWIFLIGCIIGAYYEEILHVYRYYKQYRVFDYSTRRGVLWGPLSPIYGAGAVLMSIFLIGRNEKAEVTFFKASFLGGALEYIISFIQEYVFGTSSWNYDAKILSINGRTTIPYMMFWGMLGVLFVKLIYPLLMKMIAKIPKKIFKPLTLTLTILVAFDILFTWAVMGRMAMRQEGIPPKTAVGEYFDLKFNDEYLQEKFPNMVWVKH